MSIELLFEIDRLQDWNRPPCVEASDWMTTDPLLPLSEEPVVKEMSPLSPLSPASAVLIRNAPDEVALPPVVISIDDPTSSLSWDEPSSTFKPPAVPPTAFPVRSVMAPDDPASVAEPVPNVSDPLAPSSPAWALAIAVKRERKCVRNHRVLIGRKERERPSTYTHCPTWSRLNSLT